MEFCKKAHGIEVEMRKIGFGVDIGGTTIKIGMFYEDGTLVEKWEIPTRTENKGSFILDDIVYALQLKLQEMNKTSKDIIGVGIGVPGPVGKNGLVYGCVNLGWDTIDVVHSLAKKLNVKIKVANDANVAALGEMWQGGGKGYNDVLMITLGTGVGAGVIIDGKILSGSHGAGGEIGHFQVCEDEKETCGCGKKGCLEQYASANGIVRIANQILKESEKESTLSDFTNLTSKDIYDEARNGDALAKEIVDQTCKVLGQSIANACNIIDPEVVVIGGGVSKAGDILIDGLEKYFMQYAFSACKQTKIKLALLGNDAGIYGCMKLLI